jgi:hypothetical protein
LHSLDIQQHLVLHPYALDLVKVLNTVVNHSWRNPPLLDHAVLETTLVIAYGVLFWDEGQQLHA